MSLETEVKDAVDGLKNVRAEFDTQWDKQQKEIDKIGVSQVEQTDQVQKISESITWLDEKKEQIIKTFDRMEAVETALARRQEQLSHGTVNGKTLSDAELHGKMQFDEFIRFGTDFDPTKELIEERKQAYPERMREGITAKALSLGIDPGMGYFLSAEIEAGMQRYIVESSPMDTLATVTTGTANELVRMQRATRLGITNGGWISETGARGVTATGNIGMITLVAHGQWIQPEATQESLEEPGFDGESFLITEGTFELAIAQNTAMVTGSGNGRPKGFTTYASGTDYAAGQMERVNVDDPIDAEGVVALQDALLEPYQPNATWTCRRAIKTVLRQLRADEPATADSGRFMLNEDFSQRGSATMLGAPIVLMADMAAGAAAALVLAYGDFRQGYRIYRRRGVSVLRDPFSNKPFVQFYMTQRTGGGSLNTEAIKIGVQS